jgi:hypothetical protein
MRDHFYSGRLAVNLSLSFLQILRITFRPEAAAVDTPPPGSTHCPAM